MSDVGKDPALDNRPAAAAQPARRQLVGNRWALAGAIIYLLEWVAIAGWLPQLFGFSTSGPAIPSGPGTKSADIVSAYSQASVAAMALGAGWYGLVLPGRILLIAGIRQALRRSWGDSAFADLAVAAMALSVVLETASYAVAAGVGHAAASGVDQSAVVSGDAISNLLNLSIWSPLGLSILAISVVMLQSRLFPWWLCWPGVAVGAALCVTGVIFGAGSQVGGQLYQVAGGLQSWGTLGFWVWMLVTGVILFRAAGQPRPKSAAARG